MTDIYGIISIGSKALLAQQKGIYVTGNNIANVNTPGYTRQRVNLSSDVPVNSGIGPVARVFRRSVSNVSTSVFWGFRSTMKPRRAAIGKPGEMLPNALK